MLESTLQISDIENNRVCIIGFQYDMLHLSPLLVSGIVENTILPE